MADFEIIEEVTKTIPKGKDMKKLMPFIIAGAGLGVVALLMKGKSSQPSQSFQSDDGVGSEADLGGIMNDFSNQVNQAIQSNNQEMSYQLSEVAGNLFDVVSDQNELISKLQTDLKTQMTQVSQSVYQQPTPVYIQASTVQDSGGLESHQTAGSSIYFDDNPNDTEQYYQVTSKTNSIAVKKEVAGLGNNGIGGDPKVSLDNLDRMKSDISFRQSEIERTQLIIENRSKAGLSTAAQTKWLDKINQTIK